MTNSRGERQRLKAGTGDLAPLGRTHLPITKLMLADGPITINSHPHPSVHIARASQLAARVRGADEVSGGARGDAQDKHSDTHGRPPGHCRHRVSPQKTLAPRDTRAVKAGDTTGTAETPPVASKTLAPACLRCRDTEAPVTLEDPPDFL